jgi:hypothetical protein
VFTEFFDKRTLHAFKKQQQAAVNHIRGWWGRVLVFLQRFTMHFDAPLNPF